MKKTSYLAAAALLVSGFSYAYTSEQNPDGFYAGLQLGYANTHYEVSSVNYFFPLTTIKIPYFLINFFNIFTWAISPNFFYC